jgi:hypothetical protein
MRLMFAAVFALALVVGIAFLAFGTATATQSTRRPQGPEVEPQQRDADARVLARVRRIAWEHRDIDGPLADEIIRYLNARESSLDLRAVRREVAEIAWRHREDCPDLSVIVRHILEH